MNGSSGSVGEELFFVMKGQQPYYGQIVKASKGDAKGMQALKDQIEEKDGNSNIEDKAINFSNKPIAESISKNQLRNIIRQKYSHMLREGMPRPEYEDEGDIDMEIQYYTEEMGTEVIDFAALRKYLTGPIMGFSPEAVDDAIDNNAELGYIVQR